MTAGEYEQQRADDQAADRRLERRACAPACGGTRPAAPAAPCRRPTRRCRRRCPAPRRRASSAGCTSRYVGTWNSGSLPRIERSTMTAATDGDDRRAEQRRVHVADDFLEREQHRRHGRVERRGQRAGRADRHQIPDALGRQPQPASDDRREARANLHRRALAAHRVARADAEHAGEELADRHARGESRRPTGGRPPRSAARRCRARRETPSPAGSP